MTPAAEKSSRELTTTSYAILGLLAVQPWSTYELARQMKRNVHYFWPRAESNVYAEPKRLVADGFARSRREDTGRRRRTVYTITPKGLRALERWVLDAGSDSRIEAERLVKAMYAMHGTKEALLEHLEACRAEGEARRQALRAIFEEYVAGRDPFPERLHVNVVCYRFIWANATTLRDWATKMIEVVSQWPGPTGPRERDSSVAALRDLLDQP